MICLNGSHALCVDEENTDPSANSFSQLRALLWMAVRRRKSQVHQIEFEEEGVEKD